MMRASQGRTDPHGGDEVYGSLVTEEEQQVAEKCQLIEVKYKQKAAQQRAAHIEKNAEAEALQQAIAKLKTRLSKGDEVASENSCKHRSPSAAGRATE